MDVNPWIVVASLLLVVYIVYRYLSETFSLFERLNIPGPKPVWIFGNVKSFKDKSPIEVFKEWKKVYGKVYGFYEGFRAGIVINDPELARLILSKRFENFHMRTPYRPFQYYPSKLNLVNLDGEHWKSQRNMLNKVLSFGNSMQAIIDKISRRAKTLTDNMENESKLSGGSFNISQAIDRFTTETMLSVVANLSEDEIKLHTDSVLGYQRACRMSAAADNPISGLARLFPILRSFLQPFDGEHKRQHFNILVLLREYLQKVIIEENNNYEGAKEQQSLISQLLACKVPMRDSGGVVTKRKLQEDEILAHVIALLGETFETISSAIMFVMYELALNQNIQDRLYKEMNDLYENEDEEIDYTQLQGFTYLDMIINETFRLHPIAPGISRICTSDCEINGIQFKKDMTVRLMTCTLYQDEDYFPNPDTFVPERFTVEAKETRHPFTFLPFGQGPRQCPGLKLATVEIKLAVIAVLRRFSLYINDKTEVPLKTALRPSLCPANGINLTLKER